MRDGPSSAVFGTVAPLVGGIIGLALILLRLSDADTLGLGAIGSAGLASGLLESEAWRRSALQERINRWLAPRYDARGSHRPHMEMAASVGFFAALGAAGGLLVVVSLLTTGPVHRVTLGFGGPLLGFSALLAGIGLINWRAWTR